MIADDREARLEQLIASYLQAEDAGSPCDRAALLAAHPDEADDLRRFFVEHDRFHRIAAPLRAAGTEPDATIDGAGMPAAREPELGERVAYFGDYELLKELGRGGMGVVYLARQISLNRSVALKMLKTDVLATEDERRRFQNEAEAIALLDHPHIVPILEVGEHQGRRYFSMKRISGPSLDKRLADYRTTQGRRPPRRSGR